VPYRTVNINVYLSLVYAFKGEQIFLSIVVRSFRSCRVLTQKTLGPLHFERSPGKGRTTRGLFRDLSVKIDWMFFTSTLISQVVKFLALSYHHEKRSPVSA
jgi:hypothetical protein